jgi:hypothetical protein
MPLRERALALLTSRGRNPAAEYACFLGYVLMVTIGIAHHERWFDEAQAWLLARDLDFGALMTQALRYEGTPGLWHAFLFAAVRLRAPYVTLSILGGASAVIGVFLLVRYSPFPLLVRCLLPFTFFIGYQYAIVARSYNLLAPLLFGIAIVHPRRGERPLLFFALLIALSHVSLHGSLIAGMLAVLEVLSMLRKRTRLSAARATGVGMFALSSAFIAWQLVPPPDLAAADKFFFQWSRLAVVSTDIVHAAIAESAFVSELALALSLFWLWKRRALAPLLGPLVALLALSAFRYHNVWHQGIVFLVWIFSLWIAQDRQPANASAPDHLTVALMAALVLVCGIQILWTAKTYLFDWSQPYSAGPALARYLKTLDCPGCRIHVDGFKPLAAQPYFPRNVFANINGGSSASYWMWSRSNPLVKNAQAVWNGDPDVAVLSDWSNTKFPHRGYREIARFPGGLYWKTHVYESDAFVVVARADRLPEISRPLVVGGR